MIRAIDLFEKVNLVRPIEQRRFFNALNDTLDELRTTYHDLVIKVNGKTEPGLCGRLDDRIEGLDLYIGAIADNINFANGGTDTDKGEYIRKADLAHKTEWSRLGKGRIVKRNRW